VADTRIKRKCENEAANGYGPEESRKYEKDSLKYDDVALE